MIKKVAGGHGKKEELRMEPGETHLPAPFPLQARPPTPPPSRHASRATSGTSTGWSTASTPGSSRRSG